MSPDASITFCFSSHALGDAHVMFNLVLVRFSNSLVTGLSAAGGSGVLNSVKMLISVGAPLSVEAPVPFAAGFAPPAQADKMDATITKARDAGNALLFVNFSFS